MADKALDAYTSRARSEAFTEHDQPSVFSDTVAAAFAMTRREEISSSASTAWTNKVEERAKQIGKLGGDEELARRYAMVPLSSVKYFRDFERDHGLAALQANPVFQNEFGNSKGFLQYGAYEYVRDFEKKYPGEVPDDEALLGQMRQEMAVSRMRDQDVMNRGGAAAGFVGQTGGVLTDPLVLATAPFGAAAGAGKTTLGTIGRTAVSEGAVAALTEIPVQAQVLSFKREIESPWSFADSAVNVLSAGAGGALFGGAIAGGAAGYKRALTKYREWKAKPGAAPSSEMNAAEDALEQAVSAHEQNPLREDLPAEGRADVHAHALDTAQAQLDAGAPVDVAQVVGGFEPPDPIGTAAVRAQDPAALVDVDPLQLHVDAKTFQFKGGGDAEGVTSSLRDVERFDRRLAGVALIWERADGQQFIADGHQRVALARRAIAAGQDPAEVRLNGFLLREADGVSAVDARRMAAVKNMAEGSGSALDAAKILRDVGPVGETMLPPLPPRSALVKQARGLAALGEDEFLKVINGAVDERVGAMVGQASTEPKLQSAMIEVLRRAKPENEAQARSIIEQVRTQGLETRTTTDLFGEHAYSESLYLERAQVLDASLKLAREDSVIFGGLLRNEERIAGAGSNRLDRGANLARQQEATDAATQITVRANAKGALSDQLTEAARQVRAGAKPGTIAKTFLEAARREIFQGDSGRGAPGRARSRGKAAGGARGEVSPPVRLQEIPPAERAAAKRSFRERQAGQSVDELYQVAEKHQKTLVEAMREAAADLEGEVSVADPGIKGRTGTEEKLARKGYKDAGDVTDVVRAGFITRTPEQAQLLMDRMARKFELLDEGVNVTPMGYIDHVALVRFPDGRVAELQAWSDSMAQVKFKEGHRLYEEARKLTPEQLATPEGAAKLEAINEASRQLYARAIAQGPPEWRQVAMMAFPEDMRLRVQDELAGNGAGAGRGGVAGNISKKADLVSSEPDSSTSAGLQRDQVDSPSLMKKDSTPPSSVGRLSTEGRPSQLKNLSAIDSPPRSIIHSVDDPKSAEPTITRTGTVEDADYAAVMSQYQDLLEDQGQLLRVNQTVDGVTTERPVSAVIDSLDTQEETLERIRLCSLPPRAA